MNILGIGRAYLTAMAEDVRGKNAPDLGQVHVTYPFRQPQDAHVYRATLQVVCGDTIVWQNVDIRPEHVANVRDEVLLSLIEPHFINGVSALRQRCIDMGLLQLVDSAVQSI